MATVTVAPDVAAALTGRNAPAEHHFRHAAPVIAARARAMAERFARGGRLVAYGSGAGISDAQHVAVEFMHPVIVGKRALPAVDLSSLEPMRAATMLRSDDIVMTFPFLDPPSEVRALAMEAGQRGALVLDTFAVEPTLEHGGLLADPFALQEWTEVTYHTLWETVHVFLEGTHRGEEVGAAVFLYPYLGNAPQHSDTLMTDVTASILAKVADDAELRASVAATQGASIGAAARMIAEGVTQGHLLLALGNGGSATDANDFAWDCLSPPPGYAPVPAISLSADPATITAVGNDVGFELVFVRQLIAHGRAGDIAVAFSTSGGSRNVIAALTEARQRGLRTIALLGYDGGEIRRQNLADITIVVPSDYIPRIQEVQASIYHVIRDLVERMRHDD